MNDYTPEENVDASPLYTEEDFIEPVNTATGNYPTLKTVASLATGEAPTEEEVSFDEYVSNSWDKVAGENDYLDTALVEEST